jgi:hypothetical protein
LTGVASGAELSLSFNYFLEAEGAPWDDAEILVSADGGGFTPIASKNNGDLVNGTTDWTEASFDLSVYAGSTIEIKFNFDTLDSVANLFEGWYVDDVVVNDLSDGTHKVSVGPGDVVSGLNFGNYLDIGDDDNYEPNDVPPGYPLPSWTFLSSIDGTGIQKNLDFYEIELPAGAFRFIALLRDDINAGQDLGLALTDATVPINPRALSNTPTPNEIIDITIPFGAFPGGKYSLGVFGNDSGEEYDLAYVIFPLSSPFEQGDEEFKLEQSRSNLDKEQIRRLDSLLASAGAENSLDDLGLGLDHQQRDLLNTLMGRGDTLGTTGFPAIVA